MNRYNSIWLVICFFLIGKVHAQMPVFSELLEEQQAKYCEGAYIPNSLCTEITSTSVDMLVAGKSAGEIKVAIEKIAKDYFSDAKNLNATIIESPYVQKYLQSVPLNLEFKQLDVEDADNVIGLGYEFNYELKNSQLNAQDRSSLNYRVTFNSNGLITQEPEENPYNFINSTLSISGTRSVFTEKQSEERIEAVRELIEDIDNMDSRRQLFDILADQFTNPWFYKFGAELGIESDQSFDAKQSKASAFVFAHYDDLTGKTKLGELGIVPSVRLSIDYVSPNDETPRAVAGDSTSFYRASGEASLWVPLNFNQMAFTFSYRTYHEIGASEVVKGNNLDRSHLRTYTISGPYGLYASYSSGRLPFGIEEESAVELGWQWHFMEM